MDWIISMKTIVTIILFVVYGIFYMVLGNLLVTSFFFGRVSFMAIFGLIFVTVHMVLMLSGVNKIGKTQKMHRSQYLKREESSTHIDSPIQDTCGFEHIIEASSNRICPFCGERVQFEDTVCSHCGHDI